MYDDEYEQISWFEDTEYTVVEQQTQNTVSHNIAGVIFDGV